MLLAVITWIGAGCEKLDTDLGRLLDKSEVQFEVVQDLGVDPGGNTVILINKTPKTVSMWDYGTGRSNRERDTVRFAFQGDYTIKFSVMTAGGVVEMDPVTVTVTEDNLNYVNDPLWIALSGGPGEEKTWVLDIDAKYFLGPLYFYGTTNGWLEEGGAWDGGATGCYGDDCWNWNPDYAGNSWLMEHGDYGSMTFNLKGGPFVTVEHLMIAARGTEQGTYALNVTNKTLTMTDATPLHDIGRDPVVTKWGEIKLLSLTEDALQLAVLRDNDPAEGPCLLVYNYVSKTYSDNWEPDEQPDPEPPYEGNANDDLTTSTSTTKRWTLSPASPYDWTDLGGEFLNGWQTRADYQATGWAPYDEAMINMVSLTLTKTSNSGGDYTFTDGTGAEISGSYTVDEKNNLLFDRSISFAISDWVTLATTAENSLRLIRTQTDALGNISGMWLGQRASDKNEYMVYHFIPQAASSGPADPLAAWKTALAGKTFKPDVNWFVDWLGFPPAFSGGWTSSSTFGDDFTSNGWVWDANVRAVAESARLRFFTEGEQIKAELQQTKAGQPYSAIGNVSIDVEKNILNIDMPLVDYTGTAAEWVGTTNDKSVTGDTNDWYFISHGGSNLGNIGTAGFWLGRVSQSTAAGDNNDEVLAFHYILAD